MSHTEIQLDRIIKALSIFLDKIGPEMTNYKDLNLTPPQYHMLKFLLIKGSCMVKELAEKMEVKPSAITVMIDRLVQNNYVIRHHDSQDRRVILINLTDEGKKVIQTVKQRHKAILHQYLTHLSDQEIEAFADTFEKLSELPIQTKDYDRSSCL